MSGFEFSPLPVQRVIDPSLEAMPSEIREKYVTWNSSLDADFAEYWYLQAEHIALSQQHIAMTADEALRRAPSGSPRRALLLGAGNCYDTPIAALADAFDSVTLVDVDTQASERTLASLTGRQLGKISLIGADVSGTMGPLLSDIYRLSKEHASYADFAAALTPVVDELPIFGVQPDIGRDYTFVSSQLLMTQLAGLPVQEINVRVLQAKYGHGYRTPAPDAPDAALMKGLSALSHCLQVGHVDYLRRLIADTGTVHFADTSALLVDGKDAARHNLMEYDLVLPQFAARFDMLRDLEIWDWRQRPDRIFRVISLGFTPKPETKS